MVVPVFLLAFILAITNALRNHETLQFSDHLCLLPPET